MTQEDQALLYANTVVPLIQESGFEITLTKPNNGAFNPDTGFTPGVATTSTGYAIEDEFEIESVPSSLADRIVKKVLAVEIDAPSVNEDTLSFKGADYQVLMVEPLETGEVLFYYEIYLGA